MGDVLADLRLPRDGAAMSNGVLQFRGRSASSMKPVATAILHRCHAALKRLQIGLPRPAISATAPIPKRGRSETIIGRWTDWSADRTGTRHRLNDADEIPQAHRASRRHANWSRRAGTTAILTCSTASTRAGRIRAAVRRLRHGHHDLLARSPPAC